MYAIASFEYAAHPPVTPYELAGLQGEQSVEAAMTSFLSLPSLPDKLEPDQIEDVSDTEHRGRQAPGSS